MLSQLIIETVVVVLYNNVLCTWSFSNLLQSMSSMMNIVHLTSRISRSRGWCHCQACAGLCPRAQSRSKAATSCRKGHWCMLPCQQKRFTEVADLVTDMLTRSRMGAQGQVQSTSESISPSAPLCPHNMRQRQVDIRPSHPNPQAHIPPPTSWHRHPKHHAQGKFGRIICNRVIKRVIGKHRPCTLTVNLEFKYVIRSGAHEYWLIQVRMSIRSPKCTPANPCAIAGCKLIFNLQASTAGEPGGRR